MASVLEANPVSSTIEDEAQLWRKRLEAMQTKWANLFTPRKPEPFPYHPIFQDQLQVDTMVEYFDKKQKASSFVGEYIKSGFTSDSGWLDKPTLERAMAEHFTPFLEQLEKTEDNRVIVDGRPRHKLTAILDELKKEEVRKPLAKRAFEADMRPFNPMQSKIDVIAARVSTMTSSIALNVSTRTETVINNVRDAAFNFSIQGPSRDQLDILKYGDVIPTLNTFEDETAQPAPKKSWLSSTASSIAMGFDKHVKPAISNFNEAVQNFSFKDSLISAKDDLVNTGKALKQAYKDDPTGTLKSVAIGAGSALALKTAFNTAAVATGVGLIAAPLYGLTKTLQEEYSKAKSEGQDWKQALKSAATTKVDMDLLKRSAKHSAFFGVGLGAYIGLGVGGDELASQLDTSTVSEPVAQNAPVEENIVNTEVKTAALSEVSSEEVATINAAAAESTLATIEEPVVELTAMQQKLAGLEGMTPEILESLKDASPQDVKDTAVTQLWSKDGDQSLGALLMEKAAEMGNRQAMNDVVALRDMGILSEAPSVEAQVAEATIPESISERMASENPRVVMQAKNDLAIAMLNGPEFANLGVEKNFPLGVAALEELAAEGHAKSIKDLSTLVDHGMISQDSLSTVVQMELVLHDGALAACSRSLDTCSFSESAINDAVAQSTDSKITNSSLKEAISKGFNMLQTGVNDIVPFNKAPEAGLVAAIK